MSKNRITAIAERINLFRNPNIEIGKNEQIKETGELIGYFERYDGNMESVYSNIEEDTKKVKKERREQADRLKRDARNDFEDLGIGEIY